MNRRVGGYSRLDNLLAGLEEDVLGLDDREVVAETTQLFGSGQDVRATIRDILQSHGHVDEESPTHAVRLIHERRKESRSQFTPLSVPTGLVEQRKLLETLVTESSSIPGYIRMAFSAQRRPTDSEVEAMIERLVRLGILRSKGTADND